MVPGATPSPAGCAPPHRRLRDAAGAGAAPPSSGPARTRPRRAGGRPARPAWSAGPCRGPRARGSPLASSPRRGRPGAEAMGRRRGEAPSAPDASGWRRPMSQPNDLSRSLVPLQQDSTLVAVIEMSQSSWLVAGIVPGLGRHPLKKLEPDQEALLRLLRRWQDEATEAGKTITRIAVAYEAGRDGFWLARWLRARGIEACVIHPTSVAVSREHRRAQTEPPPTPPPPSR